MTPSLFLDTGVLVAMVAARDRHRERGLVILRDVAGRRWSSVVTSDLVIAEALNFIQRKVRRRDVAEGLLALIFGRDRIPPMVKDVLRVHSGRFAAALEQYRARFDEGLSFTDWSTLVLLEEERIEELATFDAGFRGRATVVDGA